MIGRIPTRERGHPARVVGEQDAHPPVEPQSSICFVIEILFFEKGSELSSSGQGERILVVQVSPWRV